VTNNKKQVAAVLSVKGRIAADAYRIRLKISTARRLCEDAPPKKTLPLLLLVKLFVRQPPGLPDLSYALVMELLASEQLKYINTPNWQASDRMDISVNRFIFMRTTPSTVHT